jgi:high affinity sulfate transporter 1
VAVATRWLAGPAPRRDLVAGLTVAAVLVPQELAYATLAGLPAVAGLYAALAGLAVYAVLGSSPVLSVNPTATSSVLAAAAGAAFVHSGHYPAALALAAIMAGAIAIAAGIARLGFLAQLLSRPVLIGYAGGAALIITVGQTGNLLGVSVDARRATHVLTALPDSLTHASLTTLAVGLAGIAALILLPRVLPRVPAALTVVVGSIVAAAVFDLAGHGVATVGDLPRGLPGLAWPGLSAGDARSLAGPALALALVGFTEIVAQGRSFARGDGPPDANRELLALGAANVTSGLFGGFAVSSSFSCSAVNAEAGARTKRAGAVTAAVVALCLLAATGLLHDLPMATLAAVTIMSVVRLIPVRALRRLYRLQRDDFAVALAAVAGTVVLGILPGLGLAVALSIAGLLYRVTVNQTEILGYVPEQDTWRRLDRHPTARTEPGVLVLRFAGPLYFANVARFHHDVTQAASDEAPVRRVVIDARTINYLDTSAIDSLSDLRRRLAGDGIDLAVAGLRGPALDTLRRSDLGRDAGPVILYPTVRQAVAA